MKKLYHLLFFLLLIPVGICFSADANPYTTLAESLATDCAADNVEPMTKADCDRLVIALNGPTQGLALKYDIYQEALEMYGKHKNVDLIIEQEDLLKTQIENRDKAKEENKTEEENVAKEEIETIKTEIAKLESELQKCKKWIEDGDQTVNHWCESPLSTEKYGGSGKYFRAQEQKVNDRTLAYLGSRTSHFDTAILSVGNEHLLNLFLGTNEDTIEHNVLHKTIKIMAQALGTFAVLILIVGGLLMITSQGDENRLQKGKNILFYTILGLVMAFTAYILVQFVISILFTATG